MHLAKRLQFVIKPRFMLIPGSPLKGNNSGEREKRGTSRFKDRSIKHWTGTLDGKSVYSSLPSDPFHLQDAFGIFSSRRGQFH